MTTPNTIVSDSSRDLQYTRGQLIDLILEKGRFLINDKARVVKNSLNTCLVLFPQDLVPDNRLHLEEKIRHEMARTASFVDITQLNALRYIPKIQSEPPQAQWQLTLGLFLYLEDECNRAGNPLACNPPTNPNGITFLSAMRSVGATLDGVSDFESKKLHEKTLEALKLAGINTSENIAILQEWFEKGSYTIKDDRHYIDPETGEWHGVYVKLADMAARCDKDSNEFEEAMARGDDPGIDEAISYAIGNKEDVGLHDPYKHAKASVEADQQNLLDGHQNDIAGHVHNGQEARKQGILDRALGAFTDHEITESKTRQMANRDKAESILNWFPDEALEMLLHSHQTYTHAEGTDVNSVYPDEPMTTASKNEDGTSIRSAAARDKRFRVIFSSNGQHQDNAPPELAHERVAQSALHELMHIAMENMDKKDALELEKLARDTSQALRNNAQFYSTANNRTIFPYRWINGGIGNKTQILETRTLEEILDYGSRLYDSYLNQKSPRDPLSTMRKEEAVCNLYGLIHTEFRDRENPLNPIFHPPEGMEVIKEFADKTDAYFKKALVRARERNHIGLPEPTRGVELT